MTKESRIYVVGHRGLIGSRLLSRLKEEGYQNLIYASSEELDLREREATRKFFDKSHPEYVYFAAASKGGWKSTPSFR